MCTIIWKGWLEVIITPVLTYILYKASESPLFRCVCFQMMEYFPMFSYTTWQEWPGEEDIFQIHK